MSRAFVRPALLAIALVACSGAPVATTTPTPAAPVDAPPPAPSASDADDPDPGEDLVATVTETDPPETDAPKPPADDPSTPRIASLNYITWIVDAPARDPKKIGYVREGTSVRLRSPDVVKGDGCAGGWVAVEPYGYVCQDSSTTRDMHLALLEALRVARPKNDALLPYRYAFSTGAPMYGRIPTVAEQIKTEGPPDKRPKPQKLGSWSSGHEELATFDAIAATDPVPDILKDGKTTPTHYGTDHRLVRKWIPNGSMLAYSHAFSAEGRVWLLSPDLTIVPADRVRPFRTSTFHGTPLEEGKVTLPIAWARHSPVAVYRRGDEGFVAKDEKLAPRTFVALTGERVEDGRKAYLATKDGTWVLESDVAVAKKRDKLPFSIQPTQKWLDIRIRTGTLVAYVGETPVYATLISPGAGGVGPYDGTNDELVKLSTTPLGVYRVVWKTRAAAMSPEKGEPTKFWISDVPFTQYFRAPFALHVAYWHEDFGMPKSAGCVNVSPEDGKWLFGWTDPQIPPEWQGVGPSKDGGLGTAIVVSPLARPRSLRGTHRARLRDVRRRSWLAVVFLGAIAPACASHPRADERAAAEPSASTVVAPASRTAEPQRCHERIEAVTNEPDLGGDPPFDAARAEILGRARGEPMVFVRAPREADLEALPEAARRARDTAWKLPSGARIEALARALRRDSKTLRALVLREGYAFSEDPLDGLAIARLELRDLFDEPEIWLLRGTSLRPLHGARERGGWTYRDEEGKRVELLFGDRIAVSRDALLPPLHRDVRALAESTGIGPLAIVHRTNEALVADARFGEIPARVLLASDGAVLRIECMDVPDETARAVDAWIAADAPRRSGLARISAVIDDEVDEAFRFDRPEDEKTAERDGRLRPAWRDAYARGASSFTCEDTTLPVFDAHGRPWPPEVCVDFVLDTYERASGTWFAARPDRPARIHGALDFDAFGIAGGRRGVLGFESFAEAHPDLFSVRKFQGEERIPFGERTRFFRFLVDHPDALRPGDVVAIQGRKRDGLIHQHAIFVERVDPLTGFPYGLADQMKRPRRRTWEGIMAEAPLRSLLFRARPTDRVLLAPVAR